MANFDERGFTAREAQQLLCEDIETMTQQTQSNLNDYIDQLFTDLDKIRSQEEDSRSRITQQMSSQQSDASQEASNHHIQAKIDEISAILQQITPEIDESALREIAIAKVEIKQLPKPENADTTYIASVHLENLNSRVTVRLASNVSETCVITQSPQMILFNSAKLAEVQNTVAFRIEDNRGLPITGWFHQDVAMSLRASPQRVPRNT